MANPILSITKSKLPEEGLKHPEVHRFLGETLYENRTDRVILAYVFSWGKNKEGLLVPEEPNTVIYLLGKLFKIADNISIKTGTYPTIYYHQEQLRARIINPNNLSNESLGYVSLHLPNTAAGIQEAVKQVNLDEIVILGAGSTSHIRRSIEEDAKNIQITLEGLFN